MIRWLKAIVARLFRRPSLTTKDLPRTRVERAVLTSDVATNLFDGFAEHRRSDRGTEEIGWILLGYVQGDQAIAVAALPAGTHRDAGAAHVRFNTDAQAFASRILRQNDKRLQIVGIVHTHPGKMRWPSAGDLAGDSEWVSRLRGGEAVFAIGTGDGQPGDASSITRQNRDELCFSWYALAQGERQYRELPIAVTAGTDLAAPLHPIWNVIEANARELDDLCKAHHHLSFQVCTENADAVLMVIIPLSENQRLRLLLSSAEARYYWEWGNEIIAITPPVASLDQVVGQITAEIACRQNERLMTVRSPS